MRQSEFRDNLAEGGLTAAIDANLPRRELRLIVPDARSKVVRRRVAKEVAGLDLSRESDALGWIEGVSAFDAR
jgi:hypothetical protein